VVDVGDDGDVAKFHSSSSDRTMEGSAISPENRDSLFRIALKNLELERRAWRPKRKPGQRTGHTLLVAAQYSQKSPENNGLWSRFSRLANDLFETVIANRRVCRIILRIRQFSPQREP
jgi:hypothetical protein